jgi:hypothetical protein
MVQIVSFNMAGTCHVQMVHFSISGMCHGQNCLFQHAVNMVSSVSACLERVMSKILSFSMARIKQSKNQKIYYWSIPCLWPSFKGPLLLGHTMSKILKLNHI